VPVPPSEEFVSINEWADSLLDDLQNSSIGAIFGMFGNPFALFDF
jgi:hypothetical protein